MVDLDKEMLAAVVALTGLSIFVTGFSLSFRRRKPAGFSPCRILVWAASFV